MNNNTISIERYDTLLFNAIDYMLQTMDRKEICIELRMSEKEFEAVGELDKKTI